MEEKRSVFETLNAVNCNEHTEKKNGLTYLSWAWAWAEVKKRYPLSYYKIYEDENGRPYFTDGRTCWVKTGVIVEGVVKGSALGVGIEHIEYLPIMDYKNVSIPLEKVTSMDVNKSIQRSLTKACARHGLGLYIYAGEDLPEGEEEKVEKSSGKKPAQKPVETNAAPEKNSTKQKTVVKPDDEAMIQKIANWAAGDATRVLRARDGYVWEGNTLAKFYAIVAELQEQK